MDNYEIIEYEQNMQRQNKKHRKIALETLDWAICAEHYNPGFVEKERKRRSHAACFFNDYVQSGDTCTFDFERSDLESMQARIMDEWLLYREKMSDDAAKELIHQIYQDDRFDR